MCATFPDQNTAAVSLKFATTVSRLMRRAFAQSANIEDPTIGGIDELTPIVLFVIQFVLTIGNILVTRQKYSLSGNWFGAVAGTIQP